MNDRRKKIYPNQSRKAFTLVEALAVVFLSVVIIIVAYSIYLVSMKSYKRNSESAELTQNARIALERISRDIRQSAEFISDLPVDPSKGEPLSSITFQDGHNLGPGLLPNEGKIQYITYKLVGTDLHRIVSHYSFPAPADPNVWVLSSAVDESMNPPYPQEIIQSDDIKAENISVLQFWGTETITTHLEVSNTNYNFTFETKTLGRNVQ